MPGGPPRGQETPVSKESGGPQEREGAAVLGADAEPLLRDGKGPGGHHTATEAPRPPPHLREPPGLPWRRATDQREGPRPSLHPDDGALRPAFPRSGHAGDRYFPPDDRHGRPGFFSVL